MQYIYECFDCGSEYSRDEVKYLCPVCQKNYKPGNPLRGVLKVILNYDKISKLFDKSNPDWNLFSPISKEYFPNYPHGNTPFFEVPNLGKIYEFENVWIKNDSLNPSGSLKDRASFLVVAEANENNESKVVCASTGNAACSLAAVCAAEGKEAVIFVPEGAPKAKLVQIVLSGVEVITVKGDYDDAFRMSIEYTEKEGGLNRNTAYNPLTIEGKKTAGFEIFEQNNFKIPDAIIIPVGDGVIIAGIYKAFFDLKMTGLINKIPKLICVQAESSSAIHNYIQTGKYSNANDPNTIADSISVRAACNADMAKFVVKESNGFSITITDDEIVEAQKILAKTTGVFAEPSAATTTAALKKISKLKLLDKNEQIVLLITGHGLKDIDSVLKNIKIPEAIKKEK